jgi:hypothetical protein
MLFIPRGRGAEKAALPRDIQFALRVLHSKATTGGNFEKCYKIYKEYAFVCENNYDNITDGTSFTDVENL